MDDSTKISLLVGVIVTAIVTIQQMLASIILFLMMSLPNGREKWERKENVK